MLVARALQMRERAALTSQKGEPRGSYLAIQATWFSPATPTTVTMGSMGFPPRE